MTALISGEGVALELERAGLGSRVVATIIDFSAQLVALIALFVFDGIAVSGADDAAVAALVLVEVVGVLAGYPIVFEWLSHGRTPGKMAMGLRVVRDDGGPIGFRQALVRGLSGLVLEKPGLVLPLSTAAGVITMMLNPGSKRIGDLMAGTFVVNERAGPRSALVAGTFDVPWGLQEWAAGLDLTQVDDQLALAVRQFVLRAESLTPAAQQDLGEHLRRRLCAVIAPYPPPEIPTPVLLVTVLAERRLRAERAFAATAGTYATPYTSSTHAATLHHASPVVTSDNGFSPPI